VPEYDAISYVWARRIGLAGSNARGRLSISRQACRLHFSVCDVQTELGVSGLTRSV
jgi:hypothetical protein